MLTQSKKTPLGKILVGLKFCTVEQVKEGLAQAKTNMMMLGEALMELGYLDDEKLAKALAKQQGVKFVLLNKYDLPPDLVQSVGKEIVEEHEIIPVQKKGRQLTVATFRVLEFYALDNLRFILGSEVDWVMAPESQIRGAMKKYYGIGGMGDIMGGEGEDIAYKDFDAHELSTDDEEGYVAQLVQLLITDAIKQRASDIHIEPMEEKVRIRYRIDGDCQEMESPPKRLQGPLIQRVKILSKMKIEEKRVPQDGRIKTRVEGRDIDLRVSCLPCSWGESVVMRILDKAKNLVALETLGVHPTDFDRFQKILRKPNGIFLVTGPTGSGKTTTLYAALTALNKPDVKIITAEDPVEYNLSGINQAQVNHQIQLSFARILRAMLRQAPNIILVGEIRDQETAEIAIQAALTGHLVFSTLHTNDASSALTRLIDMGVKPFLVASAVQAIMAQRLVRVLCKHCKAPYTPEPAELKMVGLKPEQVKGKTLYQGVGCRECGNAGFRGRMGVYELLEMNMPLRELTMKQSSTLKIRAEARNNGMSTLLEDGVRKVLLGTTTVGEVLTIAHRDDI
ncbi:MAG: Flp pilus assembly complex ATPase component TadA [Planctomycetes bacterium]|nr:Flp pilus assembly complex ATPase component TadA [Planctomycetota bacterium]MCW8136129.1 Flp pilus assembly complex ATPase component TadA [Planctomycetota bacterium]